MREIILSTETGSDVPPDIAEKYRIQIVPMHVIMDGVDYPDGSGFPIEKIYQYYERTRKIPTTSCVNVDEYLAFFRKIREDHPDCVIMHFAYSSNASATWQAAEAAKSQMQDVYVIDTKNATGGCTAYLIAGYNLIEQKKGLTTDYAALADELSALAPRVFCAFIPGNLEFLKAGGRVSNAAYLGATILQLKPLIEIDETGTLIASKRYRGPMSKVAEHFVREFVARHDLDRETLYNIYTLGTTDDVLRGIAAIARELGFAKCIQFPVGGVITCHSGPGSIGLAGISA